MHFLPQGSPLSHRSHASRERLKVTIKSPPPPAPPCSLSLLPSHSHSPSGRLRTVQILCHPLLTTPFASDTGVPPGCLVGSARGFPSRPVVHVIRLTRVVDFHFRRLASFRFRWRRSAYLSE